MISKRIRNGAVALVGAAILTLSAPTALGQTAGGSNSYYDVKVCQAQLADVSLRGEQTGCAAALRASTRSKARTAGGGWADTKALQAERLMDRHTVTASSVLAESR
jgi:hypothetical protein